MTTTGDPNGKPRYRITKFSVFRSMPWHENSIVDLEPHERPTQHMVHIGGPEWQEPPEPTSPEYIVIEAGYYGEGRFIAKGEIVDWHDWPNERMRPKNSIAKEIFTLWEAHKDDPALPERAWDHKAQRINRQWIEGRTWRDNTDRVRAMAERQAGQRRQVKSQGGPYRPFGR